MSVSTKYDKYPKYLKVKVSGKWTRDNAVSVIEEIKVEADSQQTKRILLDLQDLSYPESEMVRFYSGEKIAEVFPYPFKIAAYLQPEKINRFAENVAVNRGADMRSFDNLTDAVSWLLR